MSEEGKSHRVKEFFQQNKRDVSITEISNGTGINRTTVAIIVDVLTEEGVVEKTRKVGKAQLYRLRDSNEKY